MKSLVFLIFVLELIFATPRILRAVESRSVITSKPPAEKMSGCVRIAAYLYPSLAIRTDPQLGVTAALRTIVVRSMAWLSVKKQTPVSTSLPRVMGPAVPPTPG
jgi:hypothetical protein